MEDFNADDQCLELVHRPEEGTTLKNGKEGERLVALSDRVCEVMADWLEVNHPGVVDDHGRTPLFATRRARLSRSRGRTIAYQYTWPCVYANTCPHDRHMDACEATLTSQAHKCPSVLSPHPVRRRPITYHLQEDTPDKVVSDRMNVSLDLLERHYDQRTPTEKLQQRRKYLPED